MWRGRRPLAPRAPLSIPRRGAARSGGGNGPAGRQRGRRAGGGGWGRTDVFGRVLQEGGGLASGCGCEAEVDGRRDGHDAIAKTAPGRWRDEELVVWRTAFELSSPRPRQSLCDPWLVLRRVPLHHDQFSGGAADFASKASGEIDKKLNLVDEPRMAPTVISTYNDDAQIYIT